MMKTFEKELMRECNVLELLLESATDEKQQKAIYDMLVSITKYLNHHRH